MLRTVTCHEQIPDRRSLVQELLLEQFGIISKSRLSRTILPSFHELSIKIPDLEPKLSVRTRTSIPDHWNAGSTSCLCVLCISVPGPDFLILSAQVFLCIDGYPQLVASQPDECAIHTYAFVVIHYLLCKHHRRSGFHFKQPGDRVIRLYRLEVSLGPSQAYAEHILHRGIDAFLREVHRFNSRE